MSVIEETTSLLTKSQLRRLKREERKNKNKNREYHNNAPLVLKKIRPITDNQNLIFSRYNEGKHLLLHGLPGTGKSYISMYLGLNEVMNNKSYNKVVVIRSTVATRDPGFLPGNLSMKNSVYEAPYVAICADLFNSGDAYDKLKRDGKIEFMSTAFIRGLTIDDSFVIVDESQNMNAMELHSIITRLGETSRIVFCGDVRQDDLTSERFKEYSGLSNFMSVLMGMNEFAAIDLGIDDIVRSGLVKSYIIESYERGIL